MGNIWPQEINGIWYLQGGTFAHKKLIVQHGGVWKGEKGADDRFWLGYVCQDEEHAKRILAEIKDLDGANEASDGRSAPPAKPPAVRGFTKCPKCGWEEGISTPKPAAENDEWEARGGAPLPDDDIPF